MTRKAKVDYEKAQYKELQEATDEIQNTNFILWVNTAATIITGLASLIIAVIALLWSR